MAFEAQRLHIGQIAFAPALDNRHDMIGIPERFARAETPFSGCPQTRRTAQPANAAKFGNAIESALRADAAVALEDSFAQMSWVAAQSPLFNAPVGAEGLAPGWNFEAAPAAEMTPVRPFRQIRAIGCSARHGSL